MSWLMAESTLPSSEGTRFAQKVSGVPLPYWQDALDGEGGAVDGAVEGEGTATVGEGDGVGLLGDDPPEHDSDVATSVASTAVRLRTRMTRVLLSETRPAFLRVAGARNETCSLPR